MWQRLITLDSPLNSTRRSAVLHTFDWLRGKLGVLESCVQFFWLVLFSNNVCHITDIITGKLIVGTFLDGSKHHI